jgi:hypothetical protein
VDVKLHLTTDEHILLLGKFVMQMFATIKAKNSFSSKTCIALRNS